MKRNTNQVVKDNGIEVRHCTCGYRCYMALLAEGSGYQAVFRDLSGQEVSHCPKCGDAVAIDTMLTERTWCLVQRAIAKARVVHG